MFSLCSLLVFLTVLQGGLEVYMYKAFGSVLVTTIPTKKTEGRQG